MSHRALPCASVAFACAFLLSAGAGHARSANAQTAQPQSSYNEPVPAAAASMAAQMVPAQAVLDKNIDARKAQMGEQFRLTLTSRVQLKNGTELPRGTELVGKITKDQMQEGGESMLAVEFTQAQLKDGKAVPIEATIVSVSEPSTSNYYNFSAAGAPPEEWNGAALQVDDVGVLSGIDLHSRIGGENSATFVSKKSDMKLVARTQFSLAIGAQAAGGAGGA
jgi:hypothetical protein